MTAEREAWLKRRKNLLTASDVAAVMGMNKHKRAEVVFNEKTGAVEPPDLSRIPAIQAGQYFEAGILQHFADAHPEFTGGVLQNGPQEVISPVLPWLAATPDGDARGETENHPARRVAVVEAKWTSTDWRGKAPEHYWVQLQVQMHCTGLPVGWITAWTKTGWFEQGLQLDLAFEVRMIADTAAFWDKVLTARGFEEEL